MVTQATSTQFSLFSFNSRDILNEPSSYSVLMGSNSLSNRHPNNTQIVEVVEIFIHPDFTKFDNEYDVALLKMATPFVLTDYVFPVCIPPTEWDFYVTAGVECMVTGWGATFQGGKIMIKPLLLLLFVVVVVIIIIIIRIHLLLEKKRFQSAITLMSRVVYGGGGGGVYGLSRIDQEYLE